MLHARFRYEISCETNNMNVGIYSFKFRSMKQIRTDNQSFRDLKTHVKNLLKEAMTLDEQLRELEKFHVDDDSSEACEEETVLPKSLDFQEMKDLLDMLAESGILKASYALKNQSWTQRSVIVAFLSGKVQRMCMWKPFAELWHCDKGALQSAYQKHCDTKAAMLYYKKLERIVG